MSIETIEKEESRRRIISLGWKIRGRKLIRNKLYLRNIFDAKVVYSRDVTREREKEGEENDGSWRKWISCVFLKMLSLFEHAPINALLFNYRHSFERITARGKGKRLPCSYVFQLYYVREGTWRKFVEERQSVNMKLSK